MSEKKRALILGITGQDGSYLADILLEKGYEVHGFIRRAASGNRRYIPHLVDRVTFHRGDLADPTSIYRAVQAARPHEIYNEADQDHVDWSYDGVGYSCDITGAAVARILEILFQLDPTIKFFQPTSCLMFDPRVRPQNEESPFRPRSPYAAAKVLAYTISRYYREVRGMFVCTGIFYKHESPRRTEEYLVYKVCRSAVRICHGLQRKLYLGNLDAEMDVGYAREYMEAVWQLMQLDAPSDYVIASGALHSIRAVVDEAFRQVGLEADDHIEIDKHFSRPGGTREVYIGDTSRIRDAIGFEAKVALPQLVVLLIAAAEEEYAQGRLERVNH